MNQAKAALLQLHKLHICHHDLKRENVVLQEGGADAYELKFVEFDCATIQKPGDCCKDFCCTARFMAPEVFSGKYDGNPVVVWSVGVIFMEMLYGSTVPE